MLALVTTLYILATYAHGVLGWGALGHQTVGYVHQPADCIAALLTNLSLSSYIAQQASRLPMDDVNHG